MKRNRTIPTNAAPRSRAVSLKLGLGAALFPMFAACSPAPMAISRSPNDPSSPSAPDGVSPLIATADVVYACPMHPEVTSTKPGEHCPKCNMKLVPKK